MSRKGVKVNYNNKSRDIDVGIIRSGQAAYTALAILEEEGTIRQVESMIRRPSRAWCAVPMLYHHGERHSKITLPTPLSHIT